MRAVAAFCLAVLFLSAAANGSSITLTSGNSPQGARDPNTVVWGAALTFGGEAFAEADAPLQQALVIGRNHDWVTLPGSEWVGVAEGEANSPDGGYVYQTHFTLPSFTQASIALTMSCDNWGKAYMNGHYLGSCTDEPPPVFSRLYTFSSSNPNYFQPGDNLLEFWVGNRPLGPGLTNPSGLVFRAEIDYVPEPSAFAAVLGGIAGLGGLALRQRRR